MKKIKILLACLAMFGMVFGFGACDDGSDDTKDNPQTNQTNPSGEEPADTSGEKPADTGGENTGTGTETKTEVSIMNKWYFATSVKDHYEMTDEGVKSTWNKVVTKINDDKYYFYESQVTDPAPENEDENYDYELEYTIEQQQKNGGGYIVVFTKAKQGALEATAESLATQETQDYVLGMVFGSKAKTNLLNEHFGEEGYTPTPEAIANELQKVVLCDQFYEGGIQEIASTGKIIFDKATTFTMTYMNYEENENGVEDSKVGNYTFDKANLKISGDITLEEPAVDEHGEETGEKVEKKYDFEATVSSDGKTLTLEPVLESQEGVVSSHITVFESLN